MSEADSSIDSSTAPESLATPAAVEVAAESLAESEVETDAAVSPVAAALAGLDRLPELELAAHAEVYQHIHAELQRALSAIDDA